MFGIFSHLVPCLMTRYESNPSAALTTSFPLRAPMAVGSQRDSRVSIRRNTTSWLEKEAILFV